MTQMGINWLNYQETVRSNLAREKETNRANLATEAENFRSNAARESETNRHNLVTENIQQGNLDELVRSNIARESENQRHNLASEIEQKRSNLATEDNQRWKNIYESQDRRYATRVKESDSLRKDYRSGESNAIAADRNDVTDRGNKMKIASGIMQWSGNILRNALAGL